MWLNFFTLIEVGSSVVQRLEDQGGLYLTPNMKFDIPGVEVEALQY